MKAVIDINVLIYDTFRDSVFHDKARSLLDRLEEWIIPLIVIYEYVWFMKGLGMDTKSSVEKAKEYLLQPKSDVIVEEVSDLIKALDLISFEGLSLSRFNDEVVLSIASKIGCIATFDDKLRKQALARGLIVLPQEI